MSKLTDTQIAVLSAATQRANGAVVLPHDLKGAAASRVIKPLLTTRLIREVPAEPDMPVWRRDEGEGQSYALVITQAGRSTMGVGSEDQTKVRAAASRDQVAAKRSPKRHQAAKSKGTAEKSKSARRSSTKLTPTPAPRAGSKLALVVKMLERTRGASIDDLTAATDWLPHTARAVITGLRNKGYRVATERNRENRTIYRIAGGGSASHRKAA